MIVRPLSSPAIGSVQVMTQPYGADSNGLICGFHFVADGSARALATATEALPLLQPQGPADGFVWLHVNLGHAGAERWLRGFTHLPDSFYEATTDGSRATRIERDEESLLAVMNDVVFDFDYDASDVSTLCVCVQPRLVVTARRHPLRSVDRLRVAVKSGAVIDSSVSLLDHLLRDQADELQRIVRRATDRIDAIEDDLLAGRHQRHTGELARLRRLMVRLQRLLAPEPSALLRMLSRPPRWVTPDDVQHLHRSHEEFALVLRDMAALQERIKSMQDEISARVAQRDSRSLFMLTVVTVLALPINLVSGMFGMNVGGIPLSGSGHGFWVMLGVIATLTAVIATLGWRRVRGDARDD